MLTDQAPRVTLKNHYEDNLDRATCLTSSAGAAAAWQCGDLIVSHGMPGYATMGRERALTLVYNSATAIPTPRISAVVSQSNATNDPDSVVAELKVNGWSTPKASASYDSIFRGAFAAKQITLGFSAASQSTGVHSFDLIVTNVYASGAYADTVSGYLIVVNRKNTEFGHGWWVAGVEQLYLSQPAQNPSNWILWVGGDGSGRIYKPAGTNTWLGPAGSYRDTLTYDSGTTTYTRTLRHRIQVKYDAAGRHIETINRAGQKSTFTWSGSPNIRLRNIEVPPDNVSGNTYTLTYQFGSEKIHKLKDPAGRELEATVTNGRITRLTDPDGNYTKFGYAGDQRMLWRKNRRANATSGADSTKYGWSSKGRFLVKAKVPVDDGGTMSITTFRTWNHQIQMSTGAGNHGITAPDSGQYSLIDGPLSVADSAKFWVDRWGAPIRIRDPLGAITNIERGDTLMPARITRVAYPDGRTVDMEWDSLGNLAQMVDNVAGLPVDTSRWTYKDADAPFAPDTIIDPVGVKTVFFYNSIGLPDSVRASNGHVTQFHYKTGSLNGLLQAVTEKSVLTYDTVSMSESSSDQRTDLDFNALGNVTQQTTPMGYVRTFTRDGFQRVSQVEDPLLHTTSYTYDDLNRLLTTSVPTDSTPLVTTNNWSVDVLTSVVDPRGVTRSYEYDAAGRDTAQVDEYGNKDIRRYDKASQLTVSIPRLLAGLSKSIKHFYDAAGRRDSTVWPKYTDTLFPTGSKTVPGDTVRYTYDVMGRMTAATSNDFKVTRQYFTNGLVKNEVQSKDDGSHSFTHVYSYDAGGRRMLHKMGSISTDSIWYKYDVTTGELDQVGVRWRSGGVKDSVLFQWDALGRRKTLTYSDLSTSGGSSVPISLDFAYDRDGRLRRICSTHSGSEPGATDAFKLRVGYQSIDKDGLTRHLSRLPGNIYGDTECPNSSSNSEFKNTYDDRHQLTIQVTTDSTYYTYDESGNMIRNLKKNSSGQTIGDKTFFMDQSPVASNRMTTWYEFTQDIPVIYHASGARRREWPGWPSQPVGTNFQLYRYHSYDALGRLSGEAFYPLWQGELVGLIDACKYGPLGRLLNACQGIHFTGPVELGYDGDNVVRTSHDADNNGVWTFVHGPGTDDVLMGHLDYGSGSHKYAYWIGDGAGRQLGVGLATGHNYATDPEYGNTGAHLAGMTNNATTFGAERLPNADLPDLSSFRNRHYDQRTGRWLQEDPLGVSAGTNLYAYVGNDPVTFTDPFGLCPPCLAIGGAALGGGLIDVGITIGVNLLTKRPALEGAGQAFLIGAAAGVAGFGVGSVYGSIARNLPKIRFAQRGVSATFRHGEFAGKSINEVAAGLKSGSISPNQLPLQVIQRNGQTYTLNNRSLLALRRAGVEPTVIKDVSGNSFFERQLTERLAEMGSQPLEFVPRIRQ